MSNKNIAIIFLIGVFANSCNQKMNQHKQYQQNHQYQIFFRRVKKLRMQISPEPLTCNR